MHALVTERARQCQSKTGDTAVLTSDHKLRDTRTVKRMCHEASRRNTDNDLPSEQPISESRPRSAANAAVTAAFSAPQEVKFTSTVNSPVRLAASDESGKDSVSLKILGGLEMLPPKLDMERLVSASHKIRKMSGETLPRTTVEPVVAHMKCGAECPLEAHVKCTVM